MIVAHLVVLTLMHIAQMHKHLTKINQQQWDYVVLQAQSQELSFSPFQVASDSYPYAEILVDSIFANSSCTEPLFFMTWGRKYGDQSNCQFYPPVCTYLGMQQRLRESYLDMTFTIMLAVRQ